MEGSSRQQEDDSLLSPLLAGVASPMRDVALRFLLAEHEAGVVIGRRGTNRNEIQDHSQARVQLSGTHEYWPGTTDRILMISGQLRSVIHALHLILLKLHESAGRTNPRNGTGSGTNSSGQRSGSHAHDRQSTSGLGVQHSGSHTSPPGPQRSGSGSGAAHSAGHVGSNPTPSQQATTATSSGTQGSAFAAHHTSPRLGPSGLSSSSAGVVGTAHEGPGEATTPQNSPPNPHGLHPATSSASRGGGTSRVGEGSSKSPHQLQLLFGSSVQATTVDDPRAVTTVRLLLPAALCGVILGPGGQTIRSISAGSGTSISLSPQDINRDLDYERVASILGPHQNTLRAVALVAGRLLTTQQAASYFRRASHGPVTPILRRPSMIPPRNMAALVTSVEGQGLSLLAPAANQVLAGQGAGPSMGQLGTTPGMLGTRISITAAGQQTMPTTMPWSVIPGYTFQDPSQQSAPAVAYLQQGNVGPSSGQVAGLSGTATMGQSSGIAMPLVSVPAHHASVQPAQMLARPGAYMQTSGYPRDMAPVMQPYSTMQVSGMQQQQQMSQIVRVPSGHHMQGMMHMPQQGGVMNTQQPQQQPQQVQQYASMQSAQGGLVFLMPQAQRTYRTYSATVMVPEDSVGAVLGRAGEQLKEVVSSSGARVVVQDRTQTNHATRSRDVIIQGEPEAISAAYQLICRIVLDHQSRKRQHWTPPQLFVSPVE